MKMTSIETLLFVCLALTAQATFADDQLKPAQTQAPEASQRQNQSPQQFVRDALLAGHKEIRLSELALQKSLDSEIKSFAQDMVQDHSKVNTELKAIARRKGLDVPDKYEYAPDQFLPDNDTASAYPNGIPAVDTDTSSPENRKSASNRDVISTRNEVVEHRNQNLERADARNHPDQQDQKSDDALQAQSGSQRRLQNLSGVEFDRAYVKEMISDHRKAVSRFELASQHLPDSELKEFATKTLPTLRTHLDHALRLQQQYSRETDVSSVK